MGGDHRALPLFWCNNQEIDYDVWCCRVFSTECGKDYYFCESCDKKYHKECVESPIQIKHPYHNEHPLKLFYSIYINEECLCCGTGGMQMGYCCSRCYVFLHLTCAMKLVPFIIDQPKRHCHPLTFFPRQNSLICNIFGLLRKTSRTYVCLICNFVSHEDCMNSPHIIRISRHAHRITYTSSLHFGEWSCGVCRKSVNGDYGAYTCVKCDEYAVHSRCALRTDVWDGEELEDVPDEDDITQDPEPFKIISKGLIHHFLHYHDFRLEVSIFYNEKKICKMCYLPIYEDNLYRCIRGDFIIHEECARARRRIQHALHPHPLTLKVFSSNRSRRFQCDACNRKSSAFAYECHKGKCNFVIDVRCASVSEPFDYKGHEHSLFLALDPTEELICEVCKLECYKKLNCIEYECKFIVCIECATLPFKAKYQHDTHFLTIKFGKDVCKEDWCEACELNLEDTNTKMIYWCDKCCTTLHVACLLGKEPYVKPGRILYEKLGSILKVRRRSRFLLK